MRALKTILIIVAALLVLFVILGLMGPKEFRIERSAYVNAPASAVYANVSSLANMNEWGPWKDMEHNMVATMSGSPDGQVGAISHWKSDESEGEQELAALEQDKHVTTKLRFISPWAANNEATFDLVPAGDSTKVTWGMQGQNNFMARVMSVFMNMDKMVGPMFEQGLGNLKKLTEEEHTAAIMAEKAKMFGGFEVATMDRPAQLYAGTRKKIKWSEMKAFFGKNFPAAYAAIGKAGVTPGVPSGVYFEWDEKNQMADVLAGIPVPADAKDKLKGLTTFEAPASKAYQIVYTGGYAGSGKAHEAMAEKMKADNVQLNTCVVEEYITDPMKEPDSTKWVTNIIYLVK